MATTFSYRLAAAAVFTALALPALAQPAPAGGPGASAAASESRAKPGAQDHRERHQAHRAQRLAGLKDQLKLTPAQEPAWTTFAAAMQPGERPARLDRKDMDQLTTPERIDRMRALRAQHAAEADRRGEATKAFYATLTPEQQKTFDTQARRHHGHPGMGGPMKGDGARHGHGPHGRGGDGSGSGNPPAAK